MSEKQRPAPLSDEKKITEPSEAERLSFGAAFERIVGLMARLRGENGCPWDRKQTLMSLRPYLIEEAYEVLDTLEADDVPAHQEELGDLLLQVIFQSEVRRQEGSFDVAHVVHGLCDKLVRRHPHVFGDNKEQDPDQAYKRWEEMKRAEKGGKGSVLDGVPKHLPSLLRAQRVSDKASKSGFDWPDIGGPLAKMSEELAEFQEAVKSGDKQAQQDEFGDLLFSMVNTARFMGINAEDALRGTVNKFSRRFQHVESELSKQGKIPAEASLDEMEALWQQAKAGD